MDCLNKIVGISNTDCECATQAVTPEDRESTSGIYIDEVEGGLKLSAIDKIGCQDFVEKTRQARKRAIDAFIETMLAQYATEGGFSRRYKPFNSRIGQVNHLRTLNNLPKYAGLRLRTRLIRGSSIKISAIGLIWSAERNVTVSIYKSHGNVEPQFLQSIENIPTIANISVTHDLNEIIELPLSDDTGRPIDYYFVYDTELSGFPRDNKATCSCGGSEAVLKSYLSIGGVFAASVGSLTTDHSSVYANGIFLEAKIDCTSKESICNLLELDETKTIAHAIAYKAQEVLIEELMGSGNINRFTMLSKEHLWGKRNHFKKEFDTRILWLAQTYPFDQVNDCVGCSDSDRMYKGLIR
ncbi:hypothetical protein FAZ19_16260 [Sphingobacterium alkalisoli]|uniref:Uncharacterized protein n=1 Tax=Sphingobacterium alkalisoli TaxID=1874115 RepID=A0A4U0GXB9_9SPHI|nr:hypothetical protein [Sphingobacterium alkalisoli]TJY63820.1 hypothetical protein FAZ19_16260 [Sphingobacterium alkalisoli]